MTQLEITIFGVTVAAIAFLLGLLTYALSRNLLPLAPTGKLWDRVYELDKLVLAHAPVFAVFMAEVNRATPYFYADPPLQRTPEFYQLKALVYFHLNVFEELFVTTNRSRWIAKQFEREGWNEYIIRKMRHPLIREVFDRESAQIYAGSFRVFVEANRSRIRQPADPNIF
jgi:hypothetical protein